MIKSFFIFSFLFLSFFEKNRFDSGETLFFRNCAVCHAGGKNVILAEKNLKKENLEANGMNSIIAISYQVRNGKNGMPAFGDRLKGEEIKKIAQYIILQAEQNFENE